MARTIRRRLPDWQQRQKDRHGDSVWSDCLLWVNRDMPPNGWTHSRRAKDLVHLRSRTKVKQQLMQYLKDPEGNPLPLSAKKLTAREFEYYQ